MFHIFLFLYFIYLSCFCSSFVYKNSIILQVSRQSSRVYMGPNKIGKRFRVKNPGNIPRKLKRTLQSVAKGYKNISSIYIPEFDSFLRQNASATVYASIMKKISKTTRHLGIEMDPSFGFRKKVAHPSIVQLLNTRNDTKIFYNALSLTNISDLFQVGNATLFVPVDAAFSQLPENYFMEKVSGNITKLELMLKSFIVPERVKIKRLTNTTYAPPVNMNGKPVVVKVGRGNEITVNEAKMSGVKNINCADGVVHLLEEFTPPNIE